ncbi:MAG TPA: lamin tail domain-containing protein [Polyangia bacterium]
MALAGLAAAAGCTPGPVTGRAAEDRTMNAGGADAPAGARDAAAAEGGASGPGGIDAGPTIDAGHRLDAPPAEMPKLPGRDAAADAAPEAISDASPADRAPDRPAPRSPRAGEIVIDELLVNPTGDDLGREWIELASLAAEPLDLSQLHLATASTDVPAPAGTIAPGALLLLGQSGDLAKNGGAPVTVAYGTKLILVNANGQLSACLGVCASGGVLDELTWGALDDGYTGHALVIDPASRALCPAGAAFGTGGSFGTPGNPNPPCTQNVDAGSQRDVSVAD